MGRLTLLLDIFAPGRQPCPVEDLFRFPEAVPRSFEVDAWFGDGDPMRGLVQPWFEELRGCGADVCELLHDGCPTACATNAAFAYVAAFAAHASVGFFFGAALEDPAGLLQGRGKRMRHVKIRWGRPIASGALKGLIAASYSDIRRRLKGGEGSTSGEPWECGD